jgi:hypothetical protein
MIAGSAVAVGVGVGEGVVVAVGVAVGGCVFVGAAVGLGVGVLVGTDVATAATCPDTSLPGRWFAVGCAQALDSASSSTARASAVGRLDMILTSPMRTDCLRTFMLLRLLVTGAVSWTHPVTVPRITQAGNRAHGRAPTMSQS